MSVGTAVESVALDDALKATTLRRAGHLDLFADGEDLDLDAGGKIELGQRIDRSRTRIQNVDQPLVRLELELLARLLVDVRRTENGPALSLCRQRDRTTHLRARLLGRANDVR